MKTYKRVLSIAGSDSGGGAGIQADIKAISACGCYAATAITAITAQNTLGVEAIEAIPAEMVERQIEAVVADIGVDAVKIGMLPSRPTIEAVARIIVRHGLRNVVLDPVMVATSGDRLIPEDAADALVSDLMPLATVFTPNIPEAEYITGLAIRTGREIETAAANLRERGARNVLLKTGHLDTPHLTDSLFADRSNGSTRPIRTVRAARSRRPSPRTWRSAIRCPRRSAWPRSTSTRRCRPAPNTRWATDTDRSTTFSAAGTNRSQNAPSAGNYRRSTRSILPGTACATAPARARRTTAGRPARFRPPAQKWRPTHKCASPAQRRDAMKPTPSACRSTGNE